MIPLSMMSVGELNTIQRIVGKDEVRKHLAELGFVIGSDIQIISKYGENLIIAIKDGRIALDKTLANKIFI